jgi:hypothetical protein
MARMAACRAESLGEFSVRSELDAHIVVFASSFRDASGVLLSRIIFEEPIVTHARGRSQFFLQKQNVGFGIYEKLKAGRVITAKTESSPSKK